MQGCLPRRAVVADRAVRRVLDNRYHYAECGLDNVCLANGFEFIETPWSKGVHVDNAEALHAELGLMVARLERPLGGTELRFLRERLEMTQEQLAELIGTTEREFLRSVGGRGADADEIVVAEAERTNLMTLAAEYAQLVASADSMAEVAERLGVKSNRIRQRIGSRSLYAIDTGGSRVFPRFQFSGAATLPGFGEVLGAFDPDTHPVAVARFFLTPTSDLESDLRDGAVSPREWLLAGLPLEPVVRLAAAP